MKAQVWYECDKGCGYKTTNKADMEQHEKACRYEPCDVWGVCVELAPADATEVSVEVRHDRLKTAEALQKYIKEQPYVVTCDDGQTLFVRKWVASKDQMPQALAECKQLLKDKLQDWTQTIDALRLPE